MTYPSPWSPVGAPPGSFDPRMARAAQIAASARNWLIVCAVGFFVGVVWITGPLCWYQATQFLRELESLGVPPPDDVRNLRLAGMITTLMFVVVCVVVALLLAALLLFGARNLAWH